MSKFIVKFNVHITTWIKWIEGTSTSYRLFVCLKCVFWASPSMRSRLFSFALHPNSLLVSHQWRDQWYFIELHPLAVCGWHIDIVAVGSSLIVSSYFCRSFFNTGLRSAWWTRRSKRNALLNFLRVSTETMPVQHRKIRNCLAMDTHYPPLMRLILGSM